MRLLLIALTCLAACLAAPEQKQKREILPGDPRYGTDYHHHHHPTNTVVESARAVGGYAYSIPDSSLSLSQGLSQNIYGPPTYQPGLPLNNDYLTPVIDSFRHAGPLPTIATPQVTKTVVGQSFVGLRPTVSSTSFPLPIEKVQTVTALPPSTSYGTPVIGHLKTLETRTHYGPAVKTVKTEIHGQTLAELPRPVGRIAEHAPLVQGVTRVTGIKSLPSVTVTKTVGGTIGAIPTLDTPTLLTNDQTTLNGGFHTGFAGLKSLNIEGPLGSIHGLKTINNDAGLTSIHGLKSLHVDTPLTSVQITKNIQPFGQISGYARADLSIPETLTHVTETIPSARTLETVTAIPPHAHTHLRTLEPLPTLHPVPSIKSVETLTHPLPTIQPAIHHPIHTVHHPAPLTSIRTVETLPTIQPAVSTIAHALPAVQPTLQPLPAIRSLETLTPIRHAHQIHTGPALTSVKSVGALTSIQPTIHSSIHSVHPVSSIKTVETLTPVHPVRPIQPIAPLHPGHHLTSVGHTEGHIDTLAPAVDSIEVLPSVQPAHGITEVVHTKTNPIIQKNLYVQRGPISDFFTGIGASLPSLPSLPQLPSLPSLPQFPSLGHGVTTVSPIEVSTPSSISSQHVDSITVDNPLFRGDTLPNHIISHHGTPSHEYIQPTDETGGYIY